MMEALAVETREPSTRKDVSSLVLGIRWSMRHCRLLLATGIAAALATGVGMLFFQDSIFESSATIVVVSPKISSELKASSLTVQGYQKLLESDAVIDETRRLLIEKGALRPKDYFRLKDELETRIFVSRYSENVALAPMVQIVVRRPKAEHAAVAANVWAEVFLRRTRDLMAGSTSDQIKFVDEQFPQSQERLKKLEGERLSSSSDFQRRLDELTGSWDEKVLKLKNDNSMRLADYVVETKRLTEDFTGANNLHTRRGQLEAYRKAYYELQVEQAQVNAQQQKDRLQLDAARKTLGEVEAFVTLRKAVSDEALWRSLVAAGGKEPDWRLLQDKSMVTQEVNPVYRDLAGRVSHLEVDERALAPRSKQLEEELARISSAIKMLDVALRLDESKLDRQTRERESGLEQLQNRVASELSDLMRDRQRSISALSMERDLRFSQLDRAIAQERDLNTELAKNFNQALLAKAQQSAEEVRLGSAGVPQDRPLPRGILINAVMAGFVGLLLGAGIAGVREAVATRPIHT